MKTKPKKLSARARKKKLTGINLAALRRDVRTMKNRIDTIYVLMQGEHGLFPRLNIVEGRVYKLERKK